MRASAVLICLTVAATVGARTITVDDDAPADFNNIQAAIDDANDGDTIIVRPGLYEECINFLGKNIALTGSKPADWKTVEETIINGMGHGPWPHDHAVIFRGTELDCMLSGFNIKGSVIGVDLLFEYEPENRMHGTISYCLFQRNYVGGAIVIEHCDGLISHCIITNTRCSTMTPISTVNDCHGLIENCTFADNPAYSMRDIDISDGGELTVRNCIARLFVAGSSTLNVEFCSVQGPVMSGAGDYTLNVGPGNIYKDPCFVKHGYLDYNETPLDANDDFWVEGDYRLKSQAGRWDHTSNSWVCDDVTSPCIDAGDPMAPIGQEPFPNAGCINMGAYGGTAEAGKSYFNAPVCETITAGDINGDCLVDFKDFRLLALHWLE